MHIKNNKGFSLVFLMTLPTLMALLALIYHLVYLVEFKSEFRFKCISESLALQKEFINNSIEGLEGSTQLLKQLQSIATPIKYRVVLSDYPKYESEGNEEQPHTLVYELNYKWIVDFYLKCGVTRIKKDNEWQYEIIYSTDYVTGADKFWSNRYF
ncbi:MAG: hypothetical protein AABY53_00415 [Bdellovibrionota bacterium]